MMRQCLVIFCTPSNALRSIACSEKEEDQFSSAQLFKLVVVFGSVLGFNSAWLADWLASTISEI